MIEFKRIQNIWFKTKAIKLGMLEDKEYSYFNGIWYNTEWNEEQCLLFFDVGYGNPRHYKYYQDKKLIFEG